ncbi:MAG: hypothetical protein ABIK51_07265 [candidate division WOR-3 bacterium]
MTLLWCLIFTAGLPEFREICNSAPPPDSQVVVNADIIAGDERFTDVTLFYSTDSQQSWIELAMSRLGTPGYESTWYARFPLPASGTVYYYIRAEIPEGAATLAPYNSANSWVPPLNLLALGNQDPTGDARSPEGNWLDLTGFRVGYSADHFYALLTNNHNSWPLYSFPQPWYIYSVGFVNPEAPSDSYVFALCYADIPAVFTTGLYLINRYTGDFSRLAGIDAQTSGNRLYLRGLIADFTSHPKFGPWPNNCGYLAVAANTQSVYPIGGNYVRDTTLPANFYAGFTPGFTVGTNQPPLLSAPAVTPRSGAPADSFLFSVRYQDPDNHLPVERAVVIDDVPFPLVAGSHRYQGGVIFRTWRSGFTAGWHRFFFQFSDGMVTVSTSVDSFLVSLTGMDGNPAGPAGFIPAGCPRIFRHQLPVATNGPLRIYNSAGQCVRNLPAGSRSWDGTDDQGRVLPAGVYSLFTRDLRQERVVKVR